MTSSELTVIRTVAGIGRQCDQAASLCKNLPYLSQTLSKVTKSGAIQEILPKVLLDFGLLFTKNKRQVVLKIAQIFF